MPGGQWWGTDHVVVFSSNIRVVVGIVASAGIMVSSLLLRSDGLVFQSRGLDLHYLSWPLMLGGALLLSGNLVSWSRRFLPPHLAWPPSPDEGEDGDGEQSPGRWRPAARVPIIQGLLLGSGWTVLLYGFLAAVPNLPGTLSEPPGATDLTLLTPYVAIFNSLAIWAAAVCAPFVVVRAVREVVPVVGEMFRFPARRLVALGTGYVILGDGGLLSVEFGFSGSRAMLALAVIVLLPYLASVLRRVSEMPLPRRYMVPVRAGLLVADSGWIALLLAALGALPWLAGGLVDRVSGGAVFVRPYLFVLDRLAPWALALLSPFILARAAAVFWPVVGTVFGFPLIRILILGGAFILFSGQGILSTAFGFPGSEVLLLLAMAIGLSYLASVLRNIGGLPLAGRTGSLATNVLPLTGSLAAAVVPALVAWAGLNYLPDAGAVLLDHRLTHSLGKAAMPYLGGFYDARYVAAGACFALRLTAGLPNPLWTPAQIHLRPMIISAGAWASGCLAWMAGTGLAYLGHAFPLFGATVGLGLLSVALTQLAAYATSSPDSVVSDTAGWLSRSKARGFLLGAALASYVLLLRPVFYEALWFAVLYEWVVVMAVVLLAFFKVRRWLSGDAASPTHSSPVWADWSRHKPDLGDRPDRRRELLPELERRYIELGEWRRLWVYLVGLLYRNNAPLESVHSVFEPLRDAASLPAGGSRLSGGDGKSRLRRQAALQESMHRSEAALLASPQPWGPISEDDLRETAGPFVENGSGAESLIALLIALYWQGGANLDLAIDRCYPVFNLVGQPPRWFHPPWARDRNRRRIREARQQFVDDVISHLFGNSAVPAQHGTLDNDGFPSLQGVAR